MIVGPVRMVQRDYVTFKALVVTLGFIAHLDDSIYFYAGKLCSGQLAEEVQLVRDVDALLH